MKAFVVLHSHALDEEDTSASYVDVFTSFVIKENIALPVSEIGLNRII